MDQYTLFLDESETFNSSQSKIFCVGGVIIKQCDCANITADLANLKLSLWDNDPKSAEYILHEKEISAAHKSRKSQASCYSIFHHNKKYRKLYAGLSKILRLYNITTIGVSVDLSRLHHLYPGEVSPKLTIALQMLFENYCHFLISNNADGDICYEALQEHQNQELRQRFYELEALGTMYYTPHCVQTHIRDIYFSSKSENLSGLQLADFIPNTLARIAAGLSPKNDDFKKTVLKQAYDGKIGSCKKYGAKVIP